MRFEAEKRAPAPRLSKAACVAGVGTMLLVSINLGLTIWVASSQFKISENGELTNGRGVVLATRPATEGATIFELPDLVYSDEAKVDVIKLATEADLHTFAVDGMTSHNATYLDVYLSVGAVVSIVDGDSPYFHISTQGVSNLAVKAALDELKILHGRRGRELQGWYIPLFRITISLDGSCSCSRYRACGRGCRRCRRAMRRGSSNGCEEVYPQL